MSRLPQVTATKLAAFLKAQGFIEQRQRGSHLRFRHPDGRAQCMAVVTWAAG
ncbi:MAG: type II toxin-antitoxin system HicA family toxin [Dehalococcoidia bacterium]